MRYYFHLRIGQEVCPDDLGMELPDVESAYLEAFQAAQDMWGELLAQRSDPLIRSFEIADEQGRVLLILPFQEVLDRARKRPPPVSDQVRSAQALLERTKSLAATLKKEMGTTRDLIANAHRTMRESRALLQRASAPRPWWDDGRVNELDAVAGVLNEPKSSV